MASEGMKEKSSGILLDTSKICKHITTCIVNLHYVQADMTARFTAVYIFLKKLPVINYYTCLLNTLSEGPFLLSI